MTNSFSGNFNVNCLATPNAKIGEHTMGTTMYVKWSEEHNTVRKKILIKKEHMCALNKRFDNIICSRKTEENKLIKLVSTYSERDVLRQYSHLCGFTGTGKQIPGEYEESNRDLPFPKRKINSQCCKQRGDYKYRQCQRFQNHRNIL